MSQLTQQQAAALKAIVEAVMAAVEAGGTMGAPGGVMYAALMAHGCSLSQFQSLMDAMVNAGKLKMKGDCYFKA